MRVQRCTSLSSWMRARAYSQPMLAPAGVTLYGYIRALSQPGSSVPRPLQVSKEGTTHGPRELGQLAQPLVSVPAAPSGTVLRTQHRIARPMALPRSLRLPIQCETVCTGVSLAFGSGTVHTVHSAPLPLRRPAAGPHSRRGHVVSCGWYHAARHLRGPSAGRHRGGERRGEGQGAVQGLPRWHWGYAAGRGG